MKLQMKHLTPLLILPLLTSCAQKQGGEGNVAGNNTMGGAAIGAIAGALLGTFAGKKNKGKNAAIGAAAGAAIGGTIGYSMDKQAAEVAKALDTQVDNSPGAELDKSKSIVVTNTDQFVKITFREAMMFPTGSSTLTTSAQNKISNLITILQKYQTTLIQVIGHTDNRGSHSFNQNLSESRAATVASIIRNSNINNAIYKRGCSFDKPIAPNTTRSNLALNRRVEIFLYPNQDAVIDQCR